MNFSVKKSVLFYFMLSLNVLLSTTTMIELLPKATNAVADYFYANCVHFLSSSTSNGNLASHRIAKIMSLETDRFFSFSNISSYYKFLKKYEKEPCTVPLRILLHLKEDDLATDFKDFHAIYEDYASLSKAGLWVIFLKSFNEKVMTKLFDNFYLPFDLEVLAAWTHEGKVHLKEIFQVSTSSPVRHSNFGVWAPETGLTAFQQPSRYDRRSNLEGLRLRVGYIEGNKPFTEMRSSATGEYLDGYFGRIWHILENLMNFSTSYYSVKLERGKGENKNSWLKIMKMLKEKKLDVALGDFVQSADRTNHFDFSYPLLVSNFQLYYQVIPEFPFQIYLFPFQTYIWLLLLNWWILSSVFVYVARRYLKKKEKSIDIPTYFFIIFGGLCAQSSSVVPNSTSCRILFLFTYIIATVMIPSYSALLTRYLSSEPKGISFDNVFDVYKSGTHEIILVDGSFEYYFFNSRSELSYLKKIFEDLQVKELPRSYDRAIHALCSRDNIAFFTISSTFMWEFMRDDHIDVRNKCALTKITQDAGILIYSLIFPKNSRFKGVIDHHLKILQCSGITRKIKNEFWIKPPKSRKKNFKTVGIKESFVIFKIAAFGVILTSIIFILEQLVKKLLKTKKPKKIFLLSII